MSFFETILKKYYNQNNDFLQLHQQGSEAWQQTVLNVNLKSINIS